MHDFVAGGVVSLFPFVIDYILVSLSLPEDCCTNLAKRGGFHPYLVTISQE